MVSSSTLEKNGPADPAPFYYMQQLYDRMVTIDRILAIKPDGSCNEQRTLRRLRLIRSVMKMLKPLLRFENLFSYFQRSQIMIMSSYSMTPAFWYAMLPGQAVFKSILEQSVINREQSNKPVVWLEWCLSTDLIFAFDAIPIIPETLVAAPIMMIGLEPNRRACLRNTAPRHAAPWAAC